MGTFFGLGESCLNKVITQGILIQQDSEYGRGADAPFYQWLGPKCCRAVEGVSPISMSHASCISLTIAGTLHGIPYLVLSQNHPMRILSLHRGLDLQT